MAGGEIRPPSLGSSRVGEAQGGRSGPVSPGETPAAYSYPQLPPHPGEDQQMPDDSSTAVLSEFEAESWPLEAAAESLHQVID